jgi:hypothetical protein
MASRSRKRLGSRAGATGTGGSRRCPAKCAGAGTRARNIAFQMWRSWRIQTRAIHRAARTATPSAISSSGGSAVSNDPIGIGSGVMRANSLGTYQRPTPKPSTKSARCPREGHAAIEMPRPKASPMSPRPAMRDVAGSRPSSDKSRPKCCRYPASPILEVSGNSVFRPNTAPRTAMTAPTVATWSARRSLDFEAVSALESSPSAASLGSSSAPACLRLAPKIGSANATAPSAASSSKTIARVCVS